VKVERGTRGVRCAGFIVAIVLAWAPVAIADSETTERPPNILFALADDWSWPHASIAHTLGVPGSDSVVQTPVFDRVARNGVLFTNAYCSAPTCSPSRSAILTGRNFWETESAANLRGLLPVKFEVYPDVLEKAGYHVGFMAKGWSPGELGDRERNPAGPRFNDFDTFIKEKTEGSPFCFWFGSKDAHRGYELDSGIRSGMNPDDVAIPAGLPDDPVVRKDLCDYYFEVQRFDRELGEMLDLLEQLGELENTLIVVAGDNGLPFPRCKTELYDTGTRVPLAVSWASAINGGRVVDDFVNLAELGPTFLEAAGLKPLETMTVKSLMNILDADAEGQVDPNRDKVFVGREYHAFECRVDDTGYPMRAVRNRDFLYIRNYEPDRWPVGDPVEFREKRGPYGEIDPSPTKSLMMERRDEPGFKRLFELSFGRRPYEELYDLRKDPGQLDNVAQEPAYADEKRTMAKMFKNEFGAEYNPAAFGIPVRPPEIKYRK